MIGKRNIRRQEAGTKISTRKNGYLKNPFHFTQILDETMQKQTVRFDEIQ